MVKSKYLVSNRINNKIYLVYNKFFPLPLYLKIESLNDIDNIDEKKKKFLKEKKIIFNTYYEEKKAIDNLFFNEYKNFKILSINKLAFHFSDKCNLNCTYCLCNGHNEISSHEMLINIKKTLTELLNVVENPKRINKIYFTGGEPLLFYKEIIDLNYYIKEKLNNRNICYSIITNGTILNDDIIDFFKKNNVLLNISLDGNKNTHDLNRKYKNESGTYDDIIKNINQFINKNICINRILCTLSSNNLNFNVDDFIKYFKYIKANILVIQINKFEIINFNEAIEKIIEIYNKAKKNNINIEIEPFLIVNRIKDLKEISNIFFSSKCPVLNKNALIIDGNGYIRNCSYYSKDKMSLVDFLDYKSKTSFYKFKKLFIDNKCFKCKFFSFCTGKCLCTDYDFDCAAKRLFANLFIQKNYNETKRDD